jgi:hypothetical protein
MWKPLSLLRSDDQATKNDMMVPKMYGGAVKASAIVLDPRLKPATIVGKKLLKPYEDVMKMFIKI